MQIINKTRQLYRKILQGKSRNSNTGQIIQTGKDLTNLQRHPGWKKVEDFMDKQLIGSEELLDQELGSVMTINIFKTISGYIKYFMVISERRAYKKIRNYMRISIERGIKYEQAQRKQEEREAKKAK